MSNKLSTRTTLTMLLHRHGLEEKLDGHQDTEGLAEIKYSQFIKRLHNV